MNPLKKIYRFYSEGFRAMTVGRTLWLVIIVKLLLMFAVIRLLFMPDILGRLDSDAERAEAVRHSLTAPEKHDSTSKTSCIWISYQP